MTKSQDDDAPVTRKILREEQASFRAEIEASIDAAMLKMARFVADQLSEQKSATDSRFSKIEKQLAGVQNSLDFLVGEYKKLDGENAASAGAIRRVDDRLDDHENRLTRLEAKTAV
ncbi:MAG: hypothetical protein LBM73_01465 [Candidatus Nomurabacteria bacterium]|jgi:chromosome segregation ATPase|nr:hypothetical protein [Candidatus Nomurabacteria bacterium]